MAPARKEAALRSRSRVEQVDLAGPPRCPIIRVASGGGGPVERTAVAEGGDRRRRRSRVDDLARATPSTRDRYMDFLRAASILAVVFGHWFISIIWWQGGLIRNTSAVGVTRGLWLGTWVFQVMPIFFFVGGFSNMIAFDAARRRGDSTLAFV